MREGGRGAENIFSGWRPKTCEGRNPLAVREGNFRLETTACKGSEAIIADFPVFGKTFSVNF
jgi:hypothetical protein